MTALLPSLPLGAIPRSSRDGPDRTRRACSEEASSVARGGPPAAACCARTYTPARMQGHRTPTRRRRAARTVKALGYFFQTDMRDDSAIYYGAISTKLIKCPGRVVSVIPRYYV